MVLCQGFTVQPKLVSCKHQAVLRYTNVPPGNWDVVKSHRLWRSTGSLPVDWPCLFTAQWNSISFFCPWQCIAIPSLLQAGGKWWSSKTNVCWVLLSASLKHKMCCTLTPLLWFSLQKHNFVPIPGQSPMAVGTLIRVFSLKGFFPKTCIAEPLCNEQGSELLAPWTITQLLNSHHYIMSLLFWHPQPSPCMFSTTFKVCISIHFYFFPWQYTEKRSPLPVFFSLYLIIPNSKFEVINIANMFLIWPDGQPCLRIFQHFLVRSFYCTVLTVLFSIYGRYWSYLFSPLLLRLILFLSGWLRSFPVSEI